MRIGELAEQVGVSVETIRYYERQGLLENPARSESNYRSYGGEATKRLGFIRQCRSLGISLREIRPLLKLAEAPGAHCGEVDVLLDEHIRKVREQRRNLAKLERQLKSLRTDCHPSMQVRGCGILQDLVLTTERKSHKFADKKVSLRP